MGKIKDVLVMTKPVQLALLMITMYGAYFAAGGPLDLRILLLLFLTGLGSAGGVTALNMYIERDIDSVMNRTKGRPLATGRLKPEEALVGVGLLIILGTLAASLINRWVLLTTLIGLYFDIIAYTELFKRHTPWALFAGSVAGSMPALGGWAAATGGFGLEGILLSAMVFVWQPLHVSSIHYANQEDYARAGIPTLHYCLGFRTYSRLIFFSLASLLALVWIYVYTAGYGVLTGVLATLLGVRAVALARRFMREPNNEMARMIMKAASPTLGIVFVLLPVEHLLVSLGVIA